MDYFYFYTLLVGIVFIFQKNLANWLAILGAVFFLFYLPTVGFYSPDYFGYEQAYESGYRISDYPWIASNARIDAEVFYLRYTAWIRVLSNFEYPFFLAVNFVICLLLSILILKGFKKDIQKSFWVMFFPILFPTLFYHLIRSSLPLFIVLLGFITLIQNKNWRNIVLALFITYVGFNFHSQYILISLLFFGVYFVMRFNSVHNYAYNFRVVIITAIGLIGILILLRNAVEELSTILSVLPASDDIAASKIGYLSKEDTRGFRITGVLSIVVYPIMIYNVIKKAYWNPNPLILNDKGKERTFLFMLLAVVFYTASINIAYIDSAHLSSRLGRFSDYLCLSVLVPLYFKICIGFKTDRIIPLLIALIAPLLYKSIYEDYYQSFEWNIF